MYEAERGGKAKIRTDTHPNGALGTAACNMMSFIVTPSERVFLIMYSISWREVLKM